MADALNPAAVERATRAVLPYVRCGVCRSEPYALVQLKRLAGPCMDCADRAHNAARSALTAARQPVPTVSAEQRARLITLTYASTDGTEYEHDHAQQDGGSPECPACWAESIRAALGIEVTP